MSKHTTHSLELSHKYGLKWDGAGKLWESDFAKSISGDFSLFLIGRAERALCFSPICRESGPSHPQALAPQVIKVAQSITDTLAKIQSYYPISSLEVFGGFGLKRPVQ